MLTDLIIELQVLWNSKWIQCWRLLKLQNISQESRWV